MYYADILSPQITLYHRGLLYHSSFLSALLSILFFLAVISFSFYYLRVLWDREEDDPKLLTYTGFIEDAGKYEINTSSFFHFISINTNINSLNDEGFDFTAFRIIGTNKYLEVTNFDKNLQDIDHWLYGQCNNESDTQGISYLINHDYFNKSACIKKYFDSKEKKYYNSNENGFKWPAIAHGNFNQNNQFYNIIVGKCNQESLDKIFEVGYKCKNESEIDDILNYVIPKFHMNCLYLIFNLNEY